MLEQCHAYVVGKDEDHDYELMKAAASLGFTSSSQLFRKGVPQIGRSRTRLSFFLVHHHLEDSSVRSLADRIRRDPSDQIRFAPLILFTHDGPFEVVLRYIRFGFDDVIALPERRELVASRLGSQLEQEFTYFETADYFGPDRRRMERPTDEPDERRSGNHPHTRHTIIRSVDRGVRVLRVETLNQKAGALPLDSRRLSPPFPARNSRTAG